MYGGIRIDFSFKIELQQFENQAANYQLASIKGRNEAKKNKPMPLIRFRKGAESKMMLSWQ